MRNSKVSLGSLFSDPDIDPVAAPIKFPNWDFVMYSFIYLLYSKTDSSKHIHTCFEVNSTLNTSSPSFLFTKVIIESASDWKSVSESNTPKGVGLTVFANVATFFLHSCSFIIMHINPKQP